ncbi:hypothetical protein [Curtobacterium sp. RRHDQ10]|uniref:hypothetical protein n=1 Tax=Curtobacterium phyllosphaerae TaxID=3413379 RepID=UPI003BF103C1
MSWLAAQIFRRYQDRRARQRAAHSSAAPPALHPILGLGGRSIELSIAADVPPDPAAFELAAEQVHAHLMQQDDRRIELVQAAQWLRDRWPSNAPASVLARLDDDLEELGRRSTNG